MALRTSLVGGLVVAAHLTTSGEAEAAPPARPVAETIDAVEARCFSHETLASKTAASLQRDEVDARLSMKIVMRGVDAFFQLSRSGAIVGERLVPRRNLTCEEFLSVLAVALAVSIDTALLDDDSPPETPAETVVPSSPLPSSLPSAAAPVADAPPRPVIPRPRAGAPWLLELALEPAMIAALHAPTIGGALGLVFARRDVGRIGLSAFATFPVETDLGAGRARVGLVAARVDGCLAPPVRKLPIAPCAAAIVGVHRAEGVVQSTSSSSVADEALWGALALGPELALAFGRWSLIARVEPWWVIRPSRLVTVQSDGAELSKTAPPIGGAAFLGVRWTIL